MNLDRQTISLIIVSFLAFIGYEYYLNQKYPNRYQKQAQHSASTSSPNTTQAEAVLAQSPNQLAGPSPLEEKKSYKQLSSAELRLENDLVSYVFNQKNAAIEQLLLKKFHASDSKEPLDLLSSYPLYIQTLSSDPGTSVKPYEGGFEANRTEKALTFTREEGPWKLSQSISLDEGYGAQILFTWQNISSEPRELLAGLLMEEFVPRAESHKGPWFIPGNPSPHNALLLSLSGKMERHDAEELCKDPSKKNVAAGHNFDLDFIGFDKPYFLAALLPESKKGSLKVLKTGQKEDACQFSFIRTHEQGMVQPGELIVATYKAWFGPKSTEYFGTFDPRLDETLDLGFFGAISHPLMAILRFIFSWVQNWGIAIILLTALLKLAFYPLTRQAAVSMHKMKQFQPEINRIKEKFKDDTRMQQQEMMRFMSLHKINPMKGCLPILPQIPVFFAFYRVLSSSIELRQAPFYGWITDLSHADPYFVTPLLLGVTMFLQQKLTPTTGMDKTQERIMMMLPILFTGMMLTLPAGMVLYMLTNTLISIGQQRWLNKRLA
ncbi:MAG: membrane protein insertase YidC [Oligoflexales bacterium]|nr:membrane protein insertase YidC [Oligoflexales bacterium]